MNDLLQLKKQPTMKINHDDQNANVGRINQNKLSTETLLKCKSNVNHKRPSLSCEISCSKRAKGHDTIKTTPQLLIVSSGGNQKLRAKVQEPTWSPLPSPQKAQQQQPASNSVLMNLLVSGCDVSAGYYTTCLPRPKVAKA